MIDWLLQQTLLLSIALLLLMSIKKLGFRFVGATGLYRLWMLIPFTLLLGALPQWADNTPQMMAYVVSVKSATSQLSAQIVELEDLLVALWLLGAVGFAITLVIAHRRYIKTLHDITAQCPTSVATVLKEHNGVTLKVYQAEDLTSPCIVGCLRPALVIPEDFENRFDSVQQRLIIRHELVHKFRGDLFYNLAAQLIVLLFWFNPLSWKGYKMFRQSQELACDQLVLADSDKSTRVAYAKAMLLCAEQDNGMFYTSLHYGAKEDMKERLTNIKTTGRTSFWKWGGVAVSLMAALVAFHSVSGAKSEKGFDVRPLTRIEPIYPQQAADEGIEGSVVLSFDINTQGKVENVKVIEANPKRYFDRASKIALRQWTYSKPESRMEDVLVQLDFALGPKDENAAAMAEKEIEQIAVSN